MNTINYLHMRLRDMNDTTLEAMRQDCAALVQQVIDHVEQKTGRPFVEVTADLPITCGETHATCRGYEGSLRDRRRQRK
jgi:hypothetical protein